MTEFEEQLARDFPESEQPDHSDLNGEAGTQQKDDCRNEEMRSLLQRREFNPDAKPPEVEPVYTLAGAVISTSGNISTINAAVKTGKTAVEGAMISSVVTPTPAEVDTLGFGAANPDGKAVLHVDTEQATEDHWRLIDRALRRGRCERPPAWLKSWCLTGIPSKKVWSMLQVAVEDAAQEFGGIHSILVDGIADLVVDVNDPAESNAFVAEVHAMAIAYRCPIIGIIHLNPGTEKSRGHLGSQLERKAETNLQLTKEGEVTSIWSAKQRRAPIPKEHAVRFRWSDEAGMHVSCTGAESHLPKTKLEQYQREVEDVFKDRPAMRYGELVKAIENTLRIKEKTAQKRAGAFIRANLISKDVCNLYVRKA